VEADQPAGLGVRQGRPFVQAEYQRGPLAQLEGDGTPPPDGLAGQDNEIAGEHGAVDR
jgi:hypothetical protein